MRWSRLAAITLGATLSLTAIPAATAFAANNQPGAEVAATAPAPSQPAGPVPSVDVLEAQMLSMINAERAAVGVAPVQPIDWAHSVAVQHSQDMAAATDIWHNISGFINQGRSAIGATYLGENVAMDSTLAADDALLYSDIPHRNVTLDARFNYVGVGIALDSKNWVYVTEDFAQIPGGAVRAAVATTRPVTTQAAPVVRAPVVAAAIRPVAPKAPATTTRATAPLPAAPGPAAAKPAAPTVAAAPAARPAQPIAAKPVSHASSLNGGLWVLLGMVGLLIAGFSARRLVAVVAPTRGRNAPSAGRLSRRQRPTAPVYSLRSAPRGREAWQPAA